MRVLGTVSLCAMLTACAFSPQVERFGVEYNSALAGMNNEQTLLNILRARDGMPTHFTSVSQFRGNINLTASASLNSQLRGEGLTDVIASTLSNTTATTASTTNVASATPSTTTVASTVTTPVNSTVNTSTIAEGVDVHTPNLSGQIVSGSAFDVAVFDSQKFFQGITNSIPFSTVDTLLNRGMDNRVLAALMIARVDFRIDVAGHGHRRGDPIASVVNDPNNAAESAEFGRFLNCYELGSAPADPANLVAISRLTRAADGSHNPIPLDKITVIDGERFGLSASEGIGSDPANDENIFLTRLTGPRRVPRLSPRSLDCISVGERRVDVRLASGRLIQVAVPSTPSADAIYLGGGRALTYSNGALHDVPVVMDITFRSPEGLFNYLGAYLRQDPRTRINIDGQALFSIAEGRNRNALAQASYRGRYYSLVNASPTDTRNAQIFTLLQQLINLHKDGADRPAAIPVRAVP